MGPLPLPILTDNGFLVSGLYGNTLTHKEPVFFKTRRKDLRPASIWEKFRAPDEKAFNASEPNLNLKLTLFLLKSREGLWYFLNLRFCGLVFIFTI